jgi:hypothetical protein
MLSLSSSGFCEGCDVRRVSLLSWTCRFFIGGQHKLSSRFDVYWIESNTHLLRFYLPTTEHVLFLSVGKSPHNWQTPPRQVTRRDTSLTFLHRHHFMSAHKSMSITIDMLLTHFFHWQRMFMSGTTKCCCRLGVDAKIDNYVATRLATCSAKSASHASRLGWHVWRHSLRKRLWQCAHCAGPGLALWP